MQLKHISISVITVHLVCLIPLYCSSIHDKKIGNIQDWRSCLEGLRKRTTKTVARIVKKPNAEALSIASWPVDNRRQQKKEQVIVPFQIGSNATVGTSANLPSNSGGVVPPDTMGAIGPRQYIIATNNGIVSYDRDTLKPDNILNISLSRFFNEFGTLSIVDPRIRFDVFSQRWFIVAARITFGDDPSKLLLAVSDGAVITECTRWSKYNLVQENIPDRNGQGGDQGLAVDVPTLAIDQFNLYIGSTMIAPNNQFVNSTVYIFKKEPLIEGEPPLVTAYRNLATQQPGTGIITPQGVDNFDSEPEFGYVIGTDRFTFGRLIMYRVLNPQEERPLLSEAIAFTVPQTQNPISVPHKGNVYGPLGFLNIQRNEGLQAAHIRNNQLYTSQDVGIDQTGASPSDPTRVDRVGVRWYQLDVSLPQGTPVTKVPDIVQVGTLFDDAPINPRFYYVGSIMTNNIQGRLPSGKISANIAIGASTSSNTEFINAIVVGRRSTDREGTLRLPVTFLTHSTASYNLTPGSTPNGQLWGDYSNTSIDPNNGKTFWTIQEFTSSHDVFGLQVAEVRDLTL